MYSGSGRAYSRGLENDGYKKYNLMKVRARIRVRVGVRVRFRVGDRLITRST